MILQSARRAIAAAAISIGSPVAQPPTAEFDAAWRQCTDHLDAAIAAGVVGCSALCVRDGAVVASAYRGYADLATQRAVDADTIYHWASNTKTFTGIAIMQLRDRGKLKLSDPILAYVPELKAVHNPFGPMQAITLEHLLAHAAGFRAPTWPWGGDESWQPFEPTEWSQIVAMLPYTKLEHAPGTLFSYSNLGIVLLGQVIERITGDDYEVYVDKNIFKPLGMYRSYFDHTPYHLLAHRSNNYVVRDGKPRANGLDFDTGITVSNGGLNAPFGDLVKYVSFLAGTDDAELAVRYESVLPRASLQDMWKPRVPTGRDRSMGLTFFLEHRGDSLRVGHTGGQRGFVTFMTIDPQARCAALGAFNTTGAGAEPATGNLSAQLRGMIESRVFARLR